MIASTEIRPYSDTSKPGRMDSTGQEWWACDPYPTWFRWENGKLITPRSRLVFPDAVAARTEATENMHKACDILVELPKSKITQHFLNLIFGALDDGERCVHADGLICGYRKDRHPLGPYGGHEFVQPRLNPLAAAVADAIVSGELVVK